MKKIITLSLVLALFSFASSAQRLIQGSISRNYRGQIARPEKRELRKDAIRYQVGRRMAQRDGIVTSMERRKLRRLKCETRRDAIRFRANGHRRVI